MKDLEYRTEEGLLIERGPGRGYRLSTSMTLNRDIHEVFEFFSDPHNLALITPRWLSLRVRSDDRIEMCRGTKIRYRFRVRGVPAIWRSEITVWEPPYRFVDEQRFGPFRKWVHEHVFEEDGGGTRAVDNIGYAVPGGRMVHGLFVAKDLRRLFTYRHRKLKELLERPS